MAILAPSFELAGTGGALLHPPRSEAAGKTCRAESLIPPRTGCGLRPAAGSAIPPYRFCRHASRLGIWVGLGLLLFLVGCRPHPDSAPAAGADSATVAVVNLSDFEWRIVVTAQRGGLTRTAQLAPRAACDLVVPAGDYLIEQTLLAPEAGADATRRFPLRVAAGKKYRWPLATLLSADADDLPAAGEGAGQ